MMMSDGAVSCDTAQKPGNGIGTKQYDSGEAFACAVVSFTCPWQGWLTVSLFSEIHDKAMAKSIKIPPKINGK
jgi:hypothetical protein